MSKDVSRKSRWSRFGPSEHRSAVGRVYYQAGQWHAAVSYLVSDPDDPTSAGPQHWELGNFKRPRNAMMAVEEKALELQRKYGGHLVFFTGSDRR